MKQIISKPFLLDFYCLLAGFALPLAFAPFSYSLIAYLSVAVFLLTLLTASTKRAAWRGYLFGVGFFALGVSWVYVSMNEYGNMPPWLAGSATALFVLSLATLTALKGYVYKRFFGQVNHANLILAFPALWLLFEFIRTYLLTGFPWLLLGYSQLYTPLSSLAPVVSVYGMSFVVALIAALLVNALRLWNEKQLAKVFLQFFVIALIILSCKALNLISWQQINGKELQVTLIQGNVPQEMKWQPENLTDIISYYYTTTGKYLSSDLILWPEAAVPVPDKYIKPFLANLDRDMKNNHTSLVFGIPIIQNEKIYNSLMTAGNAQGHYDKRHLVPFGEYVPLPALLFNFLQSLQIPLSTLSPGKTHQPLITVNHIPAASFICYETIFPNEIRRDLPKAEFIITATDDSWFGHSIAAEQHLEMTQMRALETGRYLLAATNTGITAIIGPDGRVINRLPAFQQQTLTGSIYPLTGATPWVLWGPWPLYGLLLIIFVFVIWQNKTELSTHKKESLF